MGDRQDRAVERHRHDRRPHAFLAGLVLRPTADDLIGQADRAGQPVGLDRELAVIIPDQRQIRVVARLAKVLLNGFHRQSAGHFPRVAPAHAVAHNVESKVGIHAEIILVVGPL